VAERLQPFQQWRERARFQEQPFAEVSDRLIVLFPKQNHRQILRIGQAELVQQRLVDAIERVAGGIDREAQELAQSQGVVRFRCTFWPGHDEPHQTIVIYIVRDIIASA
jgi:tRNA/tmRNA/rRNA uracil-C5-methylase (TrmA/RlmC/RlmD family)